MNKWELPAGWEWLPISTIAGKTDQRNPKQTPEKAFMYIDISAIDNNKGVIVDGGVRPCRGVDAPDRARKVVRSGDVILATTRPSLRNIAVVPEKYENAICSTGFCVLSAKGGLGVAEFIFYAVRSYFFIDQLTPYQRGANYPAVTDGVVYKSKIPVPYPDDPERSRAEQRRIAARLKGVLDEVAVIHTLQKEIDSDLTRLMDSVLAEAFAENKQQAWEHEAVLGSVVEIVAPQVDPRTERYRLLPHVSGDRIKSGTGKLCPLSTAEQDGVTSNKYYFQPGSVLYSKIRPQLRKVALVNFAGICSADIYPLVVKTSDLAPEFLKWALLSPPFTRHVVERSRRARIPKVNRPELFKYRLRYPSLPQQRQIAAQLEQVLDGITEMTDGQNLNDFEQLEQSILAQAFRGEL